MTRYRIKERIRFYYYSQFLQDADETNSVQQAIMTMMSYGEESTSEIIVNASNSLSSHLHCAKITLKKRTGLAPRPSTAVELYYVISGKGSFIDADNRSISLKANKHVIVQPWV